MVGFPSKLSLFYLKCNLRRRSILFLSSLAPLSASDCLTPEEQQAEIGRALYKANCLTQAEINSEVAHIAIETYKETASKT